MLVRFLVRFSLIKSLAVAFLPAANLMSPYKIGRDGGIRTHDTLLTYAPLAGVCLQPLSHISVVQVIIYIEYTR